MRFKLILSLALAGVVILASGAPAVAMNSAGSDLQAKSRGAIYVVRKGVVGGSSALQVLLDGHVWGLLAAPNSSQLMNVAPGQHSVTITAAPNMPVSVVEQSQTVLVEAGKTYFCKVVDPEKVISDWLR